MKTKILAVSLAFNMLFIALFAYQKILNSKISNECVNISNIESIYTASADGVSGTQSVSKEYKGGALYIGKNSSYTMSSGEIEGNTNYYGGAVYIATGGTFIMNSGTIKNCSANYGGAFYVESGATLILNGGVIESNKAMFGPTIYVESGGNVQMGTNGGTCKIQNNSFWVGGLYDISLGDDTVMVGHVENGIRMHYLYYGSYPQTYVGFEHDNSDEDSQLIKDLKLLSETQPFVKTYSTQVHNSGYGYWYAYRNPKDNCLYARGNNFYYVDTPGAETDPYYKGINGDKGEPIPTNGKYVWFKVEPVKWIVLNYEEVKDGDAKTIDLLSYNAVIGMVEFNPTNYSGVNAWSGSAVENWVNGQLFYTMFTIGEQRNVALKELYNNSVVNSEDSVDNKTYNRVYCLSYSEINKYLDTDSKRLCSPTDFALSNFCSKLALGEDYATADYPGNSVLNHKAGGTCNWRTRSLSYIENYVYVVDNWGVVSGNNLRSSLDMPTIGIRPAISIKI